MVGGGNAGDMKIVKGGDGAGWDAFAHQMRREPVVAQQVPQQVDGYPQPAGRGLRLAFAQFRQPGIARHALLVTVLHQISRCHQINPAVHLRDRQPGLSHRCEEG